MAVVKLYDALILVGGYNASGQTNRVTLSQQAAMLDASVFGVETKVNAAGLLMWSGQANGYWDVLDPLVSDAASDNQFGARLGAAAFPLCISPTTADGDPAWFGDTVESNYQYLGQIGTLLPFSISLESASDLRRGTVLLPLASRVASTNGTPRQLGAVAAGGKIVATLHVVAFDGTSLDVEIESDNLVGMGSPVSQLSFTTATGVTAEKKSVTSVGGITDDWWRVKTTFVGTSFTAFVAVTLV